MDKTKRLYLCSSLVLAAANLALFLMFFIPYYVLETDIGNLEYVRIFLSRLIEFALAPAAAVTLFLCGPYERPRKVAVRAVAPALTRIIYLLPYYYLYFIAYGYDSVESVCLSALVSLFGVLLLWGEILLFRLLTVTVARRLTARSLTDRAGDKSALDGAIYASLPSCPTGRQVFDLGTPVTAGIFTAVFAQFLISLAYEIGSTVSYLISYAGYYRVDEIIYMLVCYLYLLAELLAVHCLCYFIRIWTYKKAVD